MSVTMACFHKGHWMCPLWRRMGMNVTGPCECACHEHLPWSKRVPALIEAEERAAAAAAELSGRT